MSRWTDRTLGRDHPPPVPAALTLAKWSRDAIRAVATIHMGYHMHALDGYSCLF